MQKALGGLVEAGAVRRIGDLPAASSGDRIQPQNTPANASPNFN
jgi:hypothetical protein